MTEYRIANYTVTESEAPNLRRGIVRTLVEFFTSLTELTDFDGIEVVSEPFFWFT